MGFSSRVMQLEDWKEVHYFRPSEFGAPHKMGYEFMLWLDTVRSDAQVPFLISSSFRSKLYNTTVGGASDSAHTDTPCDAVDIAARPTPSDPHWNRARFRIIKFALINGCTRFGVYPGGSLHLDRTEDSRPGERIWIAVDNPAK